MKDIIKLLIVDDHPFFRQGVSFYLNSIDNIDLIGEVSSGEEALEFISKTDVDIILMDLQMKGIDGIDTSKLILEKRPDIKILILTSFGQEESIQRAIEIGVAGYCLKNSSPTELVAAINGVCQGGTYLGQGTISKLIGPGRKTRDNYENINENLIEHLTPREVDVLKLLVEGLTNKEIAGRLIVGEKTVKTHIGNILQKLGVSTRTQAALYASKYFSKGES